MPQIRMDRMDDFKLIDLVKQSEHLYDKNHSEYHDASKRALTWKAISVALGTTVDDCRRRFRCLRDRFTKEKRARKGNMLNDPTLPLIFKKMSFLWDHLLHRGALATRRLKKDGSSQNSEVEAQIQIIDEDMHPCDDSQHPTEELDSSQQQCRALAKTEDMAKPTVINLGSQNGQNKRSKPDDDHFAVFAQYMKENGGDQLGPNKKFKTNDDHLAAVFAQYVKRNGKDTGKHASEQQNPNKKMKPNEDQPAVEQQSPNNRLKSHEDPLTMFTQSMKEIDGDVSNVDSSLPCNEAFCAVVKDYLDQINNPVKLSLLRIQILTILHNELFSKR